MIFPRVFVSLRFTRLPSFSCFSPKLSSVTHNKMTYKNKVHPKWCLLNKSTKIKTGRYDWFFFLIFFKKISWRFFLLNIHLYIFFFSPYGLLLHKWHIKVKCLLNHDCLLNHVWMQRKLYAYCRTAQCRL